MYTRDELLSRVDAFVNNPEHHDLLSIVKGTRNGLIYGFKVRAAHALVMVLLFKSGPIKSKIRFVVNVAKEHSLTLGSFLFLYRSFCYFIAKARPNHATRDTDRIIACLIASYLVFGRDSKSRLKEQIILYVLSRLIMNLATLALNNDNLKPVKSHITGRAWPIVATLVWSMTVYLWETSPGTTHPGMSPSMKYLYTDSLSWTGLKTLLWHNE